MASDPALQFVRTVRFSNGCPSLKPAPVYPLYFFWFEILIGVGLIKSHRFCFGEVSLLGLQLYLVLCKSTSEEKRGAVAELLYSTGCNSGTVGSFHLLCASHPGKKKKNASRLLTVSAILLALTIAFSYVGIRMPPLSSVAHCWAVKEDAESAL